jgi:hypothetical protein
MAPCYFPAVSIFFMFLQIYIMLVVFWETYITQVFRGTLMLEFFTNQYECQLLFSSPSGIWGYLWG